jgi:hypothetical protein
MFAKTTRVTAGVTILGILILGGWFTRRRRARRSGSIRLFTEREHVRVEAGPRRVAGPPTCCDFQ